MLGDYPGKDQSKQLGRTFIAIFLVMVAVGVWGLIFPSKKPVVQQQNTIKAEESSTENVVKEDVKTDSNFVNTDANSATPVPQETTNLHTDRAVAVGEELSNRIYLENSKSLVGINIMGGKIDDITLKNYKEDTKKDSKNSALLSPKSYLDRYTITPHLTRDDKSIGADVAWKRLNANSLVFEENGLKVTREFALNSDYIITLKDHLQNTSKEKVKMSSCTMFNKLLSSNQVFNIAAHEGLVADVNDKLEEISYRTIIKEHKGIEKYKKYKNEKISFAGLADKYWLAAVLKQDVSIFDDTGKKISHPNVRKNLFLGSNIEEFVVSDEKKDTSDNVERAEVDLAYCNKDFFLLSGQSAVINYHIFAGAKELDALNHYVSVYNLPLFDRTIDFGWYYFLTKPLSILLSWLNSITGSFAAAILILTLLVRIVMLPLAHKSYKSMYKMKLLAPRITKIREIHKNNRAEMGKATMELYRKEKINPMSGCLPILIQIPIFFSLYKVFLVSIDMRHAPLFGWIQDLSAPDPSSLFNLFGLLPFATPEFLQIGILPILMGITMFLQQQFSPSPSDPMQAKILKAMPFFFVIIFAKFPSGLILYWVISNTVSIFQQVWIAKSMKKYENKIAATTSAPKTSKKS